MTPRPDLSIIIPAYNEESRLPRTLTRIRDYFASKNIPSEQLEILVVDDGSRDGTAQVAEKWANEMPSVRLISNGDNRGKGYSVRHGMLEARGRIALFTDADLSSPIEECEKLLAAIDAGMIVHSREYEGNLVRINVSGPASLIGRMRRFRAKPAE